MICLPFLALAIAAPFTARLLDSLPQLVKIISSGEAALINPAIEARASSRAFRGFSPKKCRLKGLPIYSPKKESIASLASGKIKEQAKWSKLICFIHHLPFLLSIRENHYRNN